MSLIFFLIILSVLVLGHELGHYTAARLMGVKAEEFGYGFPPRAIGFVRKAGKWIRVRRNDRGTYANTIWSINWLPLGGFVRLKGEQGEDGQAHDSFAAKGAWARLFILAAGVMMNWIIAIVIVAVGFSIGIPAQTTDVPSGAHIRDAKIQITDVLPKSAAEQSSIAVGDFLLAVNHVPVSQVSVAQAALKTDATTIDLTIEDHHQIKEVVVTPTYIEALKRSGVGIAMADTGIVQLSPPQAIVQSVVVTGNYTQLFLSSFGSLIADIVERHHISADVSGPVGIAVMTGKVVEEGWWPLAQFTALLSINLAIVNFLPIPALDGGRALFVVIEALRRRKNNVRVETLFHQIGFLALLTLVAVITIHDVRTYGGVIVSGVKHLIGW